MASPPVDSSDSGKAAPPEINTEQRTSVDVPQDGRASIVSATSARTPTSLAERTRKAWLKNCRKIFDEFDADGGGSIDIEEFGDLLKSAGLYFSAEDIDKICKEFDVNGDGEIDFEEFTLFLEAKGMGPGNAAAGGMQLTDALRTINTTVKENNLEISDKEQSLIEAQTAAKCPKNHIVQKTSIGELGLERFYFGLGGFICMKCDINSENLVNKNAYFCAPCHYVICSMCAGLLRQANIDAEVQRRTTMKLEGLKGVTRKPSRDSVVRRNKSKNRAKLRFNGGGMRMSICGSIDSIGVTDEMFNLGEMS